MFKRFFLVLIVLLFVPWQAFAAWPETWSQRHVNYPGEIATLVIPSPTAPSDLSDYVYCGAPNGCVIAILGGGAGTYNVMMSASAGSYETAGNYVDSGTVLAAEGVVYDFPHGRYLRLEAVLASDATGVVTFSGI